MTIVRPIAILLMMNLCTTATEGTAPGRWAGRAAGTPDTPAAEEPESSGHHDVARALGRGADELLVDEFRVLSASAAAERAEFLRHHAEESRLDLRAIVFGAGQVIPDQLPMDEVFAGFTDAVAIYFIGEPERALLYLPGPLAAEVSEAEQRRALQSSVMQAVAKADPEAQLDAFLTQLSIRLYWMEQMMDDGMVETAPILPIAADGMKDDRRGIDALRIPPLLFPWLLGAAGMGIGLTCVWWLRAFRGNRRFPDLEIEPRLGGPHGAGAGAVISYLSANLPPAEQRMQSHSIEPASKS